MRALGMVFDRAGVAPPGVVLTPRALEGVETMDRGGTDIWGVCMFVGGFASIIFWMVVAWRAMRAHEKIADAVERGGTPPVEVDKAQHEGTAI